MIFRYPACLLLILAPASLLADCASDNKGRIEDTHWVNIEADKKGVKLPAGTMKLHFSKDGSLTWEIKDAKLLKGRYMLGAGDVVIFELDEEISGSKVHKERIAIMGDRLLLSDATGRIVFERIKGDGKGGDKQTP